MSKIDMSKENILKMIKEESESLEILEQTEDYVELYDNYTNTCRYFFFNNDIEAIKERVYISPKIDFINKEELYKFLINETDVNALMCVKKCYFMFDDSDYEILVKDTEDEYGYEIINDNILGINWFDESIIIIDIKNIINSCRLEEKEDLACGLHSRYKEDLYRGIIETIIHEYRHAVFGFNVFALEDEYTVEEEKENMVEEYCRKKFNNIKYYKILQNEKIIIQK